MAARDLRHEVEEAFAYAASRLGLGRTVTFLYATTSNDVQMEIGPSKNAKEAPNEFYVGYNSKNLIESMEKQGHSPVEYIRRIALHEILHTVLWPLKTLGLKGLKESDRARLINTEEATVGMLESLLAPLVVRCYCVRNKKKKKFPHTSAQSPSIGQNLPIGDTSPNMDAANPHATSGSNSSDLSTMSNAPSPEAGSPSATSAGGAPPSKS